MCQEQLLSLQYLLRMLYYLFMLFIYISQLNSDFTIFGRQVSLFISKTLKRWSAVLNSVVQEIQQPRARFLRSQGGKQITVGTAFGVVWCALFLGCHTMHWEMFSSPTPIHAQSRPFWSSRRPSTFSDLAGGNSLADGKATLKKIVPVLIVCDSDSEITLYILTVQYESQH